MLKSRKLRGTLQLGLSLLLLAILIRRVGLDELVQTLETLDWRWYSLAFVLFLATLLLRAFRWYLLLRQVHDRPTFAYCIYLYFVGFFANNFLPSGFGGDAVKVVTLLQDFGGGAVALSSVIMERMAGLLGTAALALLALGWLRLSDSAEVVLPPAVWLSIAVISVGIPAVIILLRGGDPLSFMAARFPATSRLPLYGKVKRFMETIHRYPWPVLGQALLVSLPFTIVLAASHYSVARALDVTLPFAVFVLFAPVIGLIGLIPITFNGLGVREGIYTLLYVPLGVPAATAVAMSLALYFMRFAVGVLGGLLYGARSLVLVAKTPRTEDG